VGFVSSSFFLFSSLSFDPLLDDLLYFTPASLIALDHHDNIIQSNYHHTFSWISSASLSCTLSFRIVVSSASSLAWLNCIEIAYLISLIGHGDGSVTPCQSKRQMSDS